MIFGQRGVYSLFNILGLCIICVNVFQNIKINEEEDNPDDKDYKPHGIETKMAQGNYKRLPKMERKEIKQVGPILVPYSKDHFDDVIFSSTG